MDEFKIFKFENENNEDVVLITSTEDLYFLQDDIYASFSSTKGEKFSVVVDLFLRNGFSFNRFINLSFNGKSKCKSYIINQRDISENIKIAIKKYLKQNINLLESSALNSRLVEFVCQ